MKKILSSLAIVYLLLTSASTFAQGTKNAGQDAATNKGDILLDFGLGFGGGYYNQNTSNYFGGSSHSGIPTISVSLQKAFWEDITIGGEIAFNSYKEEYTNYNGNNTKGWYSKYNQNNTFVLGKGEYHFNRLIGLDPKFDLYAGAILGLRFSGSKVQHTDYNFSGSSYTSKSNSVDLATGAYAGFKYYFVKNISVYAELGWAITNFRTGLAWRF